jgi:hypothetical protein
MAGSPDTSRAAAERRLQRLRLATLEADVAYFQARLEILGEPATNNQKAQQKAFKHLRASLDDLIRTTKRKILDN